VFACWPEEPAAEVAVAEMAAAAAGAAVAAVQNTRHTRTCSEVVAAAESLLLQRLVEAELIHLGEGLQALRTDLLGLEVQVQEVQEAERTDGSQLGEPGNPSGGRVALQKGARRHMGLEGAC
jgi:hypothetical protein